VLERIEVWNPGIYQEYLKTQADSYEHVAQVVLQK
jgi:hypothetical protein